MRQVSGRRARTSPRRVGLAVASAAGLSTAGVLPVFLLGGLVVAIRADLPVDDARLGALVASFFLASAVASLPGGYLAERIGLGAAVVAASVCSAVALVGTAVVATDVRHLALLLVVAGLGNGIAQPTSNVVLARAVPPERQGLAFGAKQSAIPAATLIAGGAVAVLADLVGWRWAYGGWVVVAVAVVVSLPRHLWGARSPRTAGGRLREGDASLRPMLLLATAAAMGAATGTTLASFLVTSSVAGGLHPSAAGATLTAASVFGILVRLAIGVVADRMPGGHLRLVRQLSLVGSLGFLGLALDAGAPVVVAAALVAFGAGWGWPGLFNFAVVRWNRNAPGAATAITQAGVFLGGVVGPLTFGAIASRTSYAVAWSVAAAVGVACAVVLQAARRALAAERRARAAR